MADNHYESREELKSRLKNNIVSKNDNAREGVQRPSLLVYILIVVCAAAFIYAVYYYMNYSVSNEYSIVWERNGSAEGTDNESIRGYLPFAGGIIKYTRDGADFIDRNGNPVWDRSYQMTNPIADVCGDYAVIADQGSTAIYIFNGTGLTGASETLLPISLVRAAGNGVIYAVLNDSNAEYITAFNSDGTPIDLSVKSIISGDGYPFDIDVSPDGTQLITSYVGMENGQIINNVVFRNFGTVGQNADARRVVGGFSDEFEGHLAGRVYFSDNEYSQAFYDGGIVFFSTEVLTSPQVLANVTFEAEMISVASTESYSAVLTENSSGLKNILNETEAADTERDTEGSESAQEETAENTAEDTSSSSTRYVIEETESEQPLRLTTFNTKGKMTGAADIDIEYKGMSAGDDVIVVYDNYNIRVYSKKGNLRGTFEFEEGQLSAVICSSKSRELYAVSGSTIYKIKY